MVEARGWGARAPQTWKLGGAGCGDDIVTTAARRGRNFTIGQLCMCYTEKAPKRLAMHV